MPPAARISDMHTCPKAEPGPVPHVGGPVAVGATTVLIGFMPAARVGDQAICVGPPDSVKEGEPTVLINGKARQYFFGTVAQYLHAWAAQDQRQLFWRQHLVGGMCCQAWDCQSIQTQTDVTLHIQLMARGNQQLKFSRLVYQRQEELDMLCKMFKIVDNQEQRFVGKIVDKLVDQRLCALKLNANRRADVDD